MKKNIRKLLVTSAILVSAMTLASCGNGNTEKPNDCNGNITEAVKYKVNFVASSLYAISGLNKEGYEKDQEVLFSIEIKDDTYKIEKVLANGVSLSSTSNLYKFNMPDKDVNLEIKLIKVGEEKPIVPIEEAKSKFTYSDIINASAEAITPSTGDVNILVVPVEFSDLDAYSKNELSYIDLAFNGNSSDLTWESNKSFYEKSSFGNLKFNFEICDTFKPSFSSREFVSMEDDYGTASATVMREIYEKGLKTQGKAVNFNDTKYDSNGDAYIDGIWMLYNERDYNSVYGKQNFWAYCTSYYDEAGIFGENDLAFGKYANGSILFLTEGGDVPTNKSQIDAHTLIHETGHMLGFDDYYDYANTQNSYSFTGGLDMMDMNIGDHNAFGKYSLGWTKAKVVRDDATITLKPFSTTGETLILPSESFNNSAFGEYLVVEYYTPENLYERDSKHHYADSYPYFFSEKGLRIYHVDARLAKFNAKASNGVPTFTRGNYLPNDINEIPGYTENTTGTEASWTQIAHANTLDRSLNKDGKALIELVSSKNEKLYTKRYATNGDLYTTNKSNGYAFSGINQSNYFSNSKFNDGSSMKYNIQINSIDAVGISINIVTK